MRYLKTNTATRVCVGPFLDKTDGITPEVALTVTSEKLTLVVDDAGVPTLVLDVAPTASGGANDMVHITNDDSGFYDLELAAANVNYVGRAMLSLNDVATHCPVFHEFMILPAVVYDALVGGTDNLDVSVTQWTGTNVAIPDTAGYPKITIKSGSGTGELSLSSGAVSLSASGLGAAADAVWDEAASGHVAAGSFGAGAMIIRSNTAQAGASTTITLDASASAVDDFYNNQLIAIVSGTGAGQGRIIEDYVGSTKVATVASWATNPSSDSVFVIEPFGSIPGASAPTAAEVADAVCDEALSGHTTSGSVGQMLGALKARTATAQAGAASSITLDASASATDDLYNYNFISIFAGTGAGQTRQITDYVGSTKVATVNIAWAVNPSSDSVFFILPGGLDAATVATIADAVWDEARSGHATAGSFGEYSFADTIRLSGDSTAADNAEAFFDGTGYAGTNNVIPTVTTLTGHTAQTGDTYARLGAPAGASVSADVAAVKADTAAVKLKTDNLPSDPADASDVAALIATLSSKIDTVDTVVDAILADTGTDGVVVATASKTGYALSAAGIDAVMDEPVLEPSAVFAWAGATPRLILGWLGALASNKQTQTATTLTLRNRADGASLATSTCSDDATTAVKGSMT